MVQMTVSFSEQPRTVVVMGSEEVPDPPFMSEGKFDARYFTHESDAEKLRVVTESFTPGAADMPEERGERTLRFLATLEGHSSYARTTGNPGISVAD